MVGKKMMGIGVGVIISMGVVSDGKIGEMCRPIQIVE